MRAVIQRVQKGQVKVNEKVVGSIGAGLVVLLGVAVGDTEKDATFLAEKIINLRIFEDDDGKLNRSLLDTGGQILAVSQFTLMGNCQKGRRPSFIKAVSSDEAEPLYEAFVEAIRKTGVHVATGVFRTTMLVEIHNDGPVTLIIESRRDKEIGD